LSTSLNIIHQQIHDSDENELNENDELEEKSELPSSDKLLPLTASEFISAYNSTIKSTT
jgi:hypothetical protein